MKDLNIYNNMWRDITYEQKDAFNNLATHPLQSYEWGEFRKATGIKVIRKGLFINNTLTQAFQLTIHAIPHTKWTIGYLPKGILPTTTLLDELYKVGKKNRCVFIQLEPNVQEHTTIDRRLQPAAHPLFTKYTLQLDLTKSEEDLLKNMHGKTRYNIKVAQKHKVKITEKDSLVAFDAYWKLLEETTHRQGFYAHTKTYHKLMWDTLKTKKQQSNNQLQAHLFLATYQQQIVTAWILFTFHDKLYYPYGASSREHREVMAQNLMMWEAILFGKKNKLSTFDMWGSLGENPDTNDPWYGFHRFKMGYHPTLIEFIGSYDLVINPLLYQLYKLADTFRWLLLRLTSKK